jgi:hypothetical protein
VRRCRATGLGNEEVRKPSAVLDSAGLQHLDGLRRVTDAVNVRGEPQLAYRAHQKFFELFAPLAVAPVADPDQIAFGTTFQGVKEAHVRRLVPCPGASGPSAIEVQLADDGTECEDAVVVPKVVLRHRFWSCDRPVMSVVEQELVSTVPDVVSTDTCDELVSVPLVNDDESRAVQRLVEIESIEVEFRRVESVLPRFE